MTSSATPRVTPRIDGQSSIGDSNRYWGGGYFYDLYLKGNISAARSTMTINSIYGQHIESTSFKGVYHGKIEETVPTGKSFIGNLQGNADSANSFSSAISLSVGTVIDFENGYSKVLSRDPVNIKDAGSSVVLEITDIDASALTRGTLSESVLPQTIKARILEVGSWSDLMYSTIIEYETVDGKSVYKHGSLSSGSGVSVRRPPKQTIRTRYNATSGAKDIVTYYYNSDGQIHYWTFESYSYGGNPETKKQVLDSYYCFGHHYIKTWNGSKFVYTLDTNSIVGSDGVLDTSKLPSFCNAIPDAVVDDYTETVTFDNYYLVTDTYYLISEKEKSYLDTYFSETGNNDIYPRVVTAIRTLNANYKANADSTSFANKKKPFSTTFQNSLKSLATTITSNNYNSVYGFISDYENGVSARTSNIFNTTETLNGLWNPDGSPVAVKLSLPKYVDDQDEPYYDYATDNGVNTDANMFDFIKRAYNSSGKVSWNNIVGKPEKLADYGITDIYTKTEIDNKFLKKDETAETAKSIENINVGTASRPVYFVQGRPVQLSGTIGDTNHPVFLENGVFRVCAMENGYTFINCAGDTESLKVPVGTIIMRLKADPVPGYLYCNGGLYRRSTYVDLSEYLGDLFGGDSQYLKVPDYRGKFIRGMGAYGDNQSAPSVSMTQTEGLPNITGRFGGQGFGINESVTASGAFSVTSTSLGAEGGHQGNIFEFNANNCSSIYGSSDHVTVVNQAVYFFIKF